MKEIAFCIVRLASIYFIIKGIMPIAALMIIGNQAEEPFYLIQVVSIITPLVFGFILWFFPATISSILYKEASAVNVSLEAHQLVSCGVFILGVFLSVTAIPSLYLSVATYIELPAMYRDGGGKYTIISALIQFFLGGMLIVGKSQFVGLYKRSKNFGV